LKRNWREPIWFVNRTGLTDRILTSWATSGRFFRRREPSQQDSIATTVIVPLETPQSAIAPHVEVAVAPLFALFGGLVIEPGVIEEIVKDMLFRRV
jgi:hypothetical protein